MTPLQVVTFFVYLAGSVTFILGLKFLSSPVSARRGNRLAAAGMAIVVGWVFLTEFVLRDGGLATLWILAIGVPIGSVVGVLGARRVPMTAMPQMVAIFNGAGGGAAALVAAAEFLRDAGAGNGAGGANAGELLPIPFMVATLLGAVIGSVSLTGSVIAFGKLQGIVSGRPLTYPGDKIVTGLLVAGILVLGVLLTVATNDVTPFLVFVALALVLGVAAVMPIGGADMPVVISLLNSYTGIAVAATGFVLNNYALLVAGTLVGASGAILTQLMCRAMNRSIFNVLFGAFGTAGGTAVAGPAGDTTVREISAEDAAVLMAYAKKVIIVPGYGMAVAQAQQSVRELMDLLVARGVEVEFAIHPVAGRMPGHMNVLLAEANVPYDRLKEMDEINDEFATTDVALVIGANDVTNPAARTDTSSPIYGMPILNVDHAAHVVVLKRSMAAGFAGIANPLYADPKTTMLFGDAKKTVDALVSGVKVA
ncbi:MAG TPA: NAD(P)(+) transhydrogenase (Re/Si-specific) subunit beta [Candidatus Limnocylindria bacterium]|nr:NAD(P)(+) transhydrogenase (Re/Si-specific) subunit beta [Candidatus Limnocylindria bacterium]